MSLIQLIYWLLAHITLLNNYACTYNSLIHVLIHPCDSTHTCVYGRMRGWLHVCMVMCVDGCVYCCMRG